MEFSINRLNISERFDVGQSYVMHYNDGDVITSNITALVNYMYAHVKDMDSTKVCKNKFDPRSYLYTNMVWAKSYRIGCGSLLYRTDLLKLTLYCLYGPKGNIPGKPVYQTLHT
ncbi:venom allergen 5-like [Ceratina calcarata]|uniref:Venom allergen 5-like n=1 Tax=Ceratina calcarata TaxID=156304 RepID=A0AAJ7WDS1_9HYME|nr:venom allergen 5-like [Ceratina calcarata]